MHGLYVYSKFNRLSGHQLSTLMQLRLSTIYHTFTVFVQWAVEGRYDFHMLPYALKARLNPGDVEQLKKIRSLYKKGMLLLRNSRVSNVEFINVTSSGEIDISMSLHDTIKAIVCMVVTALDSLLVLLDPFTLLPLSLYSWTQLFFSPYTGSEPEELLMEFKLLAEVLDLLESNLMVIGTHEQVPSNICQTYCNVEY